MNSEKELQSQNLKPTGSRVILKFFLGAFVDIVEDGIIIPAAAQENIRKNKPKYRWVEIIAVGGGCVEVKVGQEALVHEPNVEFIAVAGEKPFNYIQEGQIMAVRDAKPPQTSP